jgi:type VI secretion system protein ImpG
MSDELLAYYNSELTYLRELGSEFAETYPKVAGRLRLEADKCDDPHVERLLEGFAFMAARIRHKLDDEFPEITDALLGVLYPHFQRPLPSMAIVQFLLGREQVKLTEGFTVPRGSRLNTRPVGGTPCSFLTNYPVTLWPIEVESARLDPDRVVHPDKPPDGVALLQIGLRCTGGTTFGELAIDRLRFYLDGTGALPAILFESLLNDACRVVVRGRLGGDQVDSVVLPSRAIEPVGFDLDEGMFPYPVRSFPGYRLIQEYLAFPEKFLFFDLTGLDRATARGFGESVDLLFFLKRPPRAVFTVQPENFRLGSTPVVNLFPQIAEPIALNQTKAEYRVVPDVHRPMATEVYSIDSVAGTAGYLDEPVQYEPFFSVRHAAEGRGARAYWYAARRRSLRKDDPGTEVDLSFVDPEFRPTAPAGEMITVRTTCTNRDLPSRLPFGGEQGDFELEGKAPVSRVRCLRRPTKTVRPPLGRASRWPLISHLALNHLSLVDTDEGLDALREMLRVYDFTDSAVTRQQIAGITRVSSRRVAGRTGRRVGNVVCLGVEVDLEFDEANYVGSGAFLLASVLERFLGLYVSINSFSQLVARTRQREGILKRWPPRAGERTLL